MVVYPLTIRVQYADRRAGFEWHNCTLALTNLVVNYLSYRGDACRVNVTDTPPEYRKKGRLRHDKRAD